uniref:Uncharacterized protein n=1 Tax=Manihot esculenta TaxID=3983 RepID=A0A2C9U1M9_MANES
MDLRDISVSMVYMLLLIFLIMDKFSLYFPVHLSFPLFVLTHVTSKVNSDANQPFS